MNDNEMKHAVMETAKALAYLLNVEFKPRLDPGLDERVTLYWKDPERANSGAIDTTAIVEWDYRNDQPMIIWRRSWQRGGMSIFRKLTQDKLNTIAARLRQHHEVRVRYFLEQKARYQAQNKRAARRIGILNELLPEVVLPTDLDNGITVFRSRELLSVFDLTLTAPTMRVVVDVSEGELPVLLETIKNIRSKSS